MSDKDSNVVQKEKKIISNEFTEYVKFVMILAFTIITVIICCWIFYLAVQRYSSLIIHKPLLRHNIEPESNFEQNFINEQENASSEEDPDQPGLPINKSGSSSNLDTQLAPNAPKSYDISNSSDSAPDACVSNLPDAGDICVPDSSNVSNSPNVSNSLVSVSSNKRKMSISSLSDDALLMDAFKINDKTPDNNVGKKTFTSKLTQAFGKVTRWLPSLFGDNKTKSKSSANRNSFVVQSEPETITIAKSIFFPVTQNENVTQIYIGFGINYSGANQLLTCWNDLKTNYSWWSQNIAQPTRDQYSYIFTDNTQTFSFAPKSSKRISVQQSFMPTVNNWKKYYHKSQTSLNNKILLVDLQRLYFTSLVMALKDVHGTLLNWMANRNVSL